MKSVKILPTLCFLLAALLLLPANALSAKPAGPELTISITGSGSVAPSGGMYT